jgi:hypothetical protein
MVSVWSSNLLRYSDPARLYREFIIESVRRAHHREKVSRLEGIYCFPEQDSAVRALEWGAHFELANLVEIHLEGGSRREHNDSNWITYAPTDEYGFLTSDIGWIDAYWRGDPFPGKSPAWELVFDGRMNVLGTAVRERAYAVIKREFPLTLGVLEISRLAAWIGSDLGNSGAWLAGDGERFSLRYIMNWKDADNPAFLKKLKELQEEGHPTNWADLGPHLEKGSFGNLPDFRSLELSVPKHILPFISSAFHS